MVVLVGATFILSLFGSFHVLRKANYTGFTIYNIRLEVAISLVNHKSVVLYSSLDSIAHRTLAYSVIPHLKQCASPSKIDFYTIDKTLERQNYLIKFGTHKVLILENKLTDFPSM